LGDTYSLLNASAISVASAAYRRWSSSSPSSAAMPASNDALRAWYAVATR
jgi:hypothetical protein